MTEADASAVVRAAASATARAAPTLSGSEQMLSTMTRSAPANASSKAVRIDGRFVGVDRDAGNDDVAGLPVVVDPAGDAPCRETELAQRVRPLACFDCHTVVAAEAVRDRCNCCAHGRQI